MNKKLKLRMKLLSNLEQLTRSHDWYYAMSEDPSVYKSGKAQARAIELLMEECNNNDMSILAKDVYNSNKPK